MNDRAPSFPRGSRWAYRALFLAAGSLLAGCAAPPDPLLRQATIPTPDRNSATARPQEADGSRRRVASVFGAGGAAAWLLDQEPLFAWGGAGAFRLDLKPTAASYDSSPISGSAEGDDAPQALKLSDAAPEEGPVFGRKEEHPWAHFDMPSASLDLYYSYTSDRSKTTAQTVKTTENLFRESLTLSTQGYIYHPNLVELSLSGSFGLEQDSFSGTEQGSKSNGTIYGFDLSALFLRNEILPVQLYGRRNESVQSRDFGPTLRLTQTTYGAAADLHLETLPMHLEASHSESDLKDPQNIQSFTQKSNLLAWNAQWIISGSQTLSASYSYNESTATTVNSQAISFQSQDASLSHSIGFGVGNTLTSTFQWDKQTGDFAQDRIRINEALHVTLSRSLETFANYTYQKQVTDAFEESEHLANIGFIHRLYDSLTTTGRVGIDLLDIGGATTTDKFGDLQLAYRKKAPYGLLALDAAVSYHTRSSDSTGPIEVLGEPHTLTDPLPVILTQPNLEVGTLRIRDASGAHVFRRGIDYMVVALPDRVEIERVLGGAIANNQTVLFDYTLGALPANVTDTLGVNLGSRYSFNKGFLAGLDVYAGYFIQNQSVSGPGADQLIADDVRELRLGALYNVGHLTARADWRKRESTLSPSTTTDLGLGYSVPITPETTVNASVGYTLIDSPADGNRTRFLLAQAGVEHQIGRNLHLSLTAAWRDMKDNLFGNNNAFEQELHLQWNFRQTTVFAQMRNATQKGTDTKESFQTAEIGIRRDF